MRLEDLPAPDDVSGITRDRFRSQVLEGYRPVVMRNFAGHWPLVREGKKSPVSAAQRLQGLDSGKSADLVTLPPGADGRMFYNDALDGMNFTREAVTISRGIGLMLERAGSQGDVTPHYAFQALSLRNHLPGLEKELDNPLLDKGGDPFVWLGNDITVAPHFDELNNIAVVAVGRRRFTLFPPEQVANLYVGRIDYTPAGQPISLVDLRNPDLTRFPRYAEAYRNALSVELGPGDAVFIPSPWWHHVESLERFNVLVNFWWSGIFVPSAVCFPMLIHALIALKNLPPPQRQAWRRMLDHYVFEDNGDPGGHLPTAARGILGELTPERVRQLHQWLSKSLK